MLRALLSRWRRGRRPVRPALPARFRPDFEQLEGRVVPSVTAIFLPQAHLLTVLGDANENTITLSRDAAGTILVNGGAARVLGGTPTVANTALVQVFGLAGNDTLTLDEANGALPAANLFGGAGDDFLVGGSGNDLLFGQSGNDALSGKGGNDLLFGGAGSDVLTGGAGDDQVFGEAGNDRMVWNPGDGNDLNEGGAGNDVVEVNGGNGAETFTVTPNGTRVRLDRTTPAPFFVDIGTTEALLVSMNGGDDTFTASNGLATLITLTVNGGAGNDTITGGDGADLLFGGDGNDLMIGGRGNDQVFMGAGDDTFAWNPGDGSDTVEGQDGHDTMVFNGANVAEQFDIFANGPRVRFNRNIGGVSMDLNGVERVDLNALGGADLITVNDLSGTALTEVNVNLQAGTGGGDGAADAVVVNGTGGADQVAVRNFGGTVVVSGLAASVAVTGSEGDKDQLVVKAQGGDDNVNASTVPADVILLTLDGGTGDDTLVGSRGADTLLGGAGDDFVIGFQGDDHADLGAGRDTFEWAPGDGSDVVDGGDGSDTMIFDGAEIDETVDIAANGNRVRFFRNPGNVTMDLHGVEEIDFNALGGADTITVNDLRATDVSTVNLNLGSPAGTGDGAADSVIINGTDGDDAFQIATVGAAPNIVVGELFQLVNISGAEAANDRLTINALGGNDTVDAGSLSAGLIGLTLNGGTGNDTLVGGGGNDLVNGGQGADTAFLGTGDDTFVWNPGDGSDTVEGQGGFDTMLFNGANIAEHIDISANGPRVRFTRDVAGITMDLNGVEAVNFNALGGADQIVVHDLSGTDVTGVNLDLASPPGTGAGDGAADTVIVEGTNGNDAVTAAGDASGVVVFGPGLAAQVNVTGAEAANDSLVIKALAGDDVVTAALPAGTIRLTADGGEGDDVLVGSPGNDTLLGGDGDDVLIGNGGLDVLDGGPGDNVLIP